MGAESGKRAVTKRTIMKAARKLYEKQGIENTAFSDIAEEAGVSRSTVFNYFASTSDLLTALCGQEVNDLQEAYDESGCCGREGIMCIFDTLLMDTACYPQLVTQLIYTAVMSGEENNPLRMIEQLIRKNLQGKESCKEEKIILLTGAYYGIVNHYHLHDMAIDADKMKKEMRNMIDMILG